jgi:hypothetical protein
MHLISCVFLFKVSLAMKGNKKEESNECAVKQSTRHNRSAVVGFGIINHHHAQRKWRNEKEMEGEGHMRRRTCNNTQGSNEKYHTHTTTYDDGIEKSLLFSSFIHAKILEWQSRGVK